MSNAPGIINSSGCTGVSIGNIACGAAISSSGVDAAAKGRGNPGVGRVRRRKDSRVKLFADAGRVDVCSGF
jgi:hypothetical protein